MSCSPSLTQTIANTEAPPPQPEKLYKVIVGADGRVLGKDACKWSSRCGALIRALIPISYRDWRNVDSKYKDDHWNAMMKEFEINIEPHVARPLVMDTFSQFFRTEKHHLRRGVIRTSASMGDALAKCPKDINKVWWEGFVQNEWSDKKMAQCKKNAKNRACNQISHTLGRRSYSRVYESMKRKNPEGKNGRPSAWKVAHTRKNGEVLPSAKEKYDQIVDVEEKRGLASEHGSTMSIDDIEHDELAEVFGPDKRSRCRAMSSTSVKQVKRGIAAKAVAEAKTGAKLDEWKAQMEATIKTLVQESMKEFAGMYFNMQHLSQQNPPEWSTSRTEFASTSRLNQLLPQNLSNAFDTLSTPTPVNRNYENTQTEKQYVMLISRDQTEVAKGYLFANCTGVCHMRKVAPDERVVWVTEVKDPEARIYEAPQNGHYKLREIADDGGFLIWLQGRLRYL